MIYGMDRFSLSRVDSLLFRLSGQSANSGIEGEKT